jgi:hypothetical protein
MTQRSGTRYKSLAAKGLYIALEDINLDWNQKDLPEFRRLVSEGYELEQIGRFFKRPVLDVFLLYLDLLEKNEIKATYKVVKINESEKSVHESENEKADF